jgi:anti-sigma regulatory factor (Ser/Thr protein kinase)
VVTNGTTRCPPAIHILAELPYQASAVPQARRVLRECLSLARLSYDTCGVSELLVSELVTNAVKYGKPPVWLLVELRPGLVHASVSDSSTVLPERRDSDPDAEGGRGLLVLDALAGSWGAVAVDGGKYLWFDLPVEPEPEPGLSPEDGGPEDGGPQGGGPDSASPADLDSNPFAGFPL